MACLASLAYLKPHTEREGEKGGRKKGRRERVRTRKIISAPLSLISRPKLNLHDYAYHSIAAN
jgi:hypothetical protein